MSRFRNPLFIVGAGLILAAVFVADVARSRVEFLGGGAGAIREVLLIAAFGLLYAALIARGSRAVRALPREMGKIVVIGVSLLLGAPLVTWVPGYEFVDRNGAMVPQNITTVFLSAMIATALVLYALVLLQGIAVLALHKRKKGTGRNLLVYLVSMAVGALASVPGLGTAGGIITSAAFVVAVLAAIIVSFRQGWIVYLSRREKLYSIAYSALIFLANVVLVVLLSNRTPISKALFFYSVPLEQFVTVNALFGSIYFGMTFVSTLFHLPTAEVYERRRSELSSLHNLSRLITRVFDFQDLVNTVTRMAREVSGASNAWLELTHEPEGGGPLGFEIAAVDGIQREDVELAVGGGDSPIRTLVLQSRKPLMIESVARDRRAQALAGKGLPIASLLSVPLVSQDRLVGILHATSDREYAFDQEEMEVLRTLGDHVTIAIENSRLIQESMTRERYRQEMMVAQHMQKRLLPQDLPEHPAFELAAVSEPSSEVGGDYYDVVYLDENRLGIVVGDVSGKGVSAAFYMAEVKGIFQSLSKLYLSPRDLLVRANETLLETLDRNSFVSFLYGILDVQEGVLTLSRAGHCPMLYVSGDRRELIRPDGLGLGLAKDEIFAHNVEERVIRLIPGDVCVFYTDGVTESRNINGEDYGEERLVDLVARSRECSAREIKEHLWNAIRVFTSGSPHIDDLTFVILTWKGRLGEDKRGGRTTATFEAQRR